MVRLPGIARLLAASAALSIALPFGQPVYGSPAPLSCLKSAGGGRTTSTVDALSSASGSGITPIGGFEDEGRIFVILPAAAVLVVPPGLVDGYLGSVNAAGSTILMFKSPGGGSAQPTDLPGWNLPSVTVLRAPPVTNQIAFKFEERHYVFLATAGKPADAACRSGTAALLPGVGGIAVRSADSVKVELNGSEASVLATEITAVIMSSCCSDRPTPGAIDPRQAMSKQAFVRAVEGHRFFDSDYRLDWTDAARDGFDMIASGFFDEARQSFALVRRRLKGDVPEIISLLEDLAHLESPPDPAPAVLPPASVEEASARLRSAREIIDACRRHNFTRLGTRSLSFAELLPPAAALPPRLAAILARCEAEYFLRIGEFRQSLTRLRGPEWDVLAETEDPHFLLLNAILLERVSQDELARFARRRLTEALRNAPVTVDLRALKPYFRFEVMFDPEFLMNFVLDRKLSFGDSRIDAEALASAIAHAPISSIVGRSRTILETQDRFAPPIVAFLHRTVLVRLADTLDAPSADALGPAQIAELAAALQAMARYSALSDRQSAIQAEQARAVIALGLADDALALIAALLTSASTQDGSPAGGRTVLAGLIDDYLRLRAALSGRAPFDDRLWSVIPADPGLKVLLAQARERLELGTVRAAIAGQPSPPAIDAERALHLRIERLDVSKSLSAAPN